MNKYTKYHESKVYLAKKKKKEGKKISFATTGVTISPILSLNTDNQREKIKHLLHICRKNFSLSLANEGNRFYILISIKQI